MAAAYPDKQLCGYGWRLNFLPLLYNLKNLHTKVIRKQHCSAVNYTYYWEGENKIASVCDQLLCGDLLLFPKQQCKNTEGNN